jgi:flagellar basal body rod protein FlgG
VNTPGYRARSVVNADALGGGVRVSEVREDPTPAAPDVLSFSGNAAVEGSNVDLGTEAAGNVLITAAYNASAAVLRAENNLLGTVINLKR